MTGAQFGGFWRRALAYGIDKTILYLFSFLLFLTGLLALGMGGGSSIARWAAAGGLPSGRDLLTSAVLAILEGRSDLTWFHGMAFAILYTLTTTLAGMAYFTWFHGTGGRTPGKMLLGLRVIRTSGEPMGFGIAFLRWVGYIVSALPFWLGFIWIALDGKKQGWHDKIAATLVVRTGREPDPSASSGEADPSEPVPPTGSQDERAVPAPLPAPQADPMPSGDGASPSGSPWGAS